MSARTANEIAQAAVRRAGQLLRGRAVAGVDAQVAATFWYGAVDIHPKHCVVWLLLQGPGSTDIPPRYMGGPASLKAETVQCLKAIVAEVHGLFREQKWKWSDPRIGFESEERVREGGGWHYFK